MEEARGDQLQRGLRKAIPWDLMVPEALAISSALRVDNFSGGAEKPHACSLFPFSMEKKNVKEKGLEGKIHPSSLYPFLFFLNIYLRKLCVLYTVVGHQV